MLSTSIIVQCSHKIYVGFIINVSNMDITTVVNIQGGNIMFLHIKKYVMFIVKHEVFAALVSFKII